MTASLAPMRRVASDRLGFATIQMTDMAWYLDEHLVRRRDGARNQVNHPETT